MKQKYIYEILHGKSTSDLSEKVNNDLKFGWELQGGVSAGELRDGSKILYQGLKVERN